MAKDKTYQVSLLIQGTITAKSEEEYASKLEELLADFEEKGWSPSIENEECEDDEIDEEDGTEDEEDGIEEE